MSDGEEVFKKKGPFDPKQILIAGIFLWVFWFAMMIVSSAIPDLKFVVNITTIAALVVFEFRVKTGNIFPLLVVMTYMTFAKTGLL